MMKTASRSIASPTCRASGSSPTCRAGHRAGQDRSARPRDVPRVSGRDVRGPVTFVLHELDGDAHRQGAHRGEEPRAPHQARDVRRRGDRRGRGRARAPRRPVSAVIDSGSRQVVLVDRGEGASSRASSSSARGDGFVEIAEGVKDGEQVVVAANFLIDAESNLKAALAGFTADARRSSPRTRPVPSRASPR